MEGKDTPLYRMRHSLAHVLAQAVLEIRPKAKLAFGPPIDTGCYYDFLFDEPLSSDDFRDIEKRMKKIIRQRQPFEERHLPGADAVRLLEERGETFKAEYCRELIERGNATIGFYTNGPFDDMCEGPHLAHTGEIPEHSFTLDSLAGAYWRGSEKNPQLTRIYVLAFETREELDEYVRRRKLAQERDHRKLGKELEIFLFSDDVGPGLPLWMPNGTVLRDELENFAKEVEARAGYQRVATPHLAKESMYIKSGHLPYYKDGMFPPMELEGESKYYLKAMNCPHHHQIYSHRPRSYRELPLRLAEYGTCYRFEPSGTLAGLLRVRSLSMNDAHIYCTLEQLESELISTFKMIVSYYEKFRFEGIQVRLSTHNPEKKEKFVDNPELWKFSEEVVEKVVKELGYTYHVGEGEAAFYGPKIDFQAKTLLGREETLSTTQLDFAQPINFDLSYVGEDGKEHRPYIVHRAPLSTHERFLAFLIEHFGGAFPTWMAAEQVRIVPVAEAFVEYAEKIERALRENLYRVSIDRSHNSFNKKVREAITSKIPNILILGDKELQSESVTHRRYSVKEQRTVPFAEFEALLARWRKDRVMDNCGEE
ncbi:MAG: threonine--tRNA ligase [Bdellovibrionales bacterium]|nr:threonine--tRNA ligase [Bdellovibrionales bacterium]